VSVPTGNVPNVTERPLELLHAIAGPDANFRQGQREGIHAIVSATPAPGRRSSSRRSSR
jgi:hypothetical protein